MLLSKYAASHRKPEVTLCPHHKFVCHPEPAAAGEGPAFSGNWQPATGHCFSSCQDCKKLNMMSSRFRK